MLLATDLVGGAPLTDVAVESATPGSLAAIGTEIARFLACLHRPALLDAVESALGALGSPEPQATSDEIREGVAPWVRRDQLATILEWCDWVDETQSTTRRRILVHGDLHGHNQVWDLATPALRLVVDYEHSSACEPEFDLRYLVSQGRRADLLLATTAAYEALTDRRVELARVMAWHVRTMLGDALWRSRAGVPLPDVGTPEQWVDRIDERFGLIASAPRLPR